MNTQFSSERRHAISWFLAVLSVGLFAVQLSLTAMTWGGVSVLAREQSASVIGIGASVAPNEFNTLAQDLKQRSDELNTREKEVSAREAALGEEYRNAIAANNRLTLYVLSGVTAFLVLLIGLNFYLDYKREYHDEVPQHPVHHVGELQTRL